MKLYETDLLKHYQNEWILDVRATDPGTLIRVERAFYTLVEEHGFRAASSLETLPIGKNNREKRQLKAPLLKLNGVPYIIYGWGSGHIGYFMDEFPEFPIIDPHPYEKTDTCMDDADTVYLSLAFTQKVNRAPDSWREDTIYYWNGVGYWMGDRDTDVGLHVFTRRSKEPEKLVPIQDRLF